MKKEVVVLVVLIFLISFVSAIWFDNLGKITGWPIAEDLNGSSTETEPSNETEEDKEDVEPEPEPPPEKEVCCKITRLMECISCPPEVDYVYKLEKECGYSLAPGAEESYEVVDSGYCEEPPEPPPDAKCEEGDEKYYICDDGTKIPKCKCENGDWVCKISPENECPDVPEPEICAAKIKATFNKGTYQIGEPIKLIVEIFDSEGNHIPNYAFHATIYDTMWHTADSQKTDNKGYFVYNRIAEKPEGGVSKIKFKAYTKKTSSCGSVEDIVEVRFELGECGFGGCVPEPECKDKIRKCGGPCKPCPEDDEDGEIFYACSGCELNDKCYPYGFRKTGRYCSDENNEFVSQRGANEKCENNFECSTNLCISGECISDDLWNKFLAWVKNLFGGGKEKETDCSKLLIEKNIKDWEYLASSHGAIKESQVPVYSKDGTYIETLKCCMAGYKYEETGEEKAVLVCEYDNRQDLVNSLYWILITKQGLYLDFDLTQYKGEKVYGSSDIAVVWTSDNHLVGSGGDPRFGTPLSEDITDAYLKKYKNDLEEIDFSYKPDVVDPKPFVFCSEEDKEKAKECHSRGGAGQSDPSTLDGTEEAIRKCKESKGFGEGCCEVYTGCIMPDENCEEITIVSKDECYWHVARLNQDADLCEKIRDIYYKDKCLRDIIGTTQDSDTCGKISDTTEKADCYVDLAIKNSDASICGKITYNDKHRDKCYIHLAEHVGDTSICKKISEDSLREKCYFWGAEQEGDVGVCDGIVDSDLQAMCYVEVAEKTSDASYCEKIVDSYIIGKCFREVGIATNDVSLCEKITDPQEQSLNPKDECYMGIGIQTNDRSLCEKILWDQAKQKCLDNTE